MKNKKALAILAIVLLLCAFVAAWFVIRSQRAKTPNVPPMALLRVDSLDETNRVATISDGGSRDPDGTLRSWRISWGDGKDEEQSSVPQKVAHTYAAEGEYVISLWCVDNLGATCITPAMTNITFDFLKRQKALEMAQAEAKRQADAKREADRLKEEEVRKQAALLEQERQRQMELAAQKAREQQELEQKRMAEAELARQKAAAVPPPVPLGAAMSDKPSSRDPIYTPAGSTLGDFEIYKEKTEGKANDGNSLVVLVTRCVNFPGIPVPPADWQIDGKTTHVQAGRIRASLSPGQHEVTALFTPKTRLQPKELKADVTVDANGDCVVVPRK